MRQAAVVTEGTMRAAPLLGLPALLSRFGLSAIALLDEVGLPRDLLDDPENTLEVEAGVRLLALGAERSDCPHFGLLLGQDVQPAALGLIGLLAQNAVDVGAGLRGLILTLHLNGHAVVPALTIHSGEAELELRLLPDLDVATGPSVDLSMAVTCNVLRALCGPGFEPTEVLLTHGIARERAPYRRFFRTPVHFGRERNALLFPATWLTARVHGASAAARAKLEHEVAALAGRHKLAPMTRARRAIFACIAFGDVSVERVAAMMGLHARTLNRHLAENGTSVFELLKEVRFQIARDLLANTGLPVTEIAATLLYTDVGGFSRAFAAWSGTSPSTWRKSHSLAVPG
jgi:AraC-like DNA-binding protein